MSTTLRLGDLSIELTRKPVKHVHLSVHPPQGRVSLIAPVGTRTEVARAYAISKLSWIRAQRARFAAQAREAPRRFVGRETHYLWGRRYLLAVEYQDARSGVKVAHRRIRLIVRPESSETVRARVMHEWHKSLLHQAVPRLIAKWEPRLGVRVAGYFLQRMKTKWGGCTPHARHIRVNTELVKKPKDLLEYVIVHEMMHLIEPKHSERFVALLDEHYPIWREARMELNELPLSSWRCGGHA
ncbi:MAG: M48 family metallopeptidase [Burkholderiales bacterium]|nr:M48 family metallopeptidase [Burkholderiales bacterium]